MTNLVITILQLVLFIVGSPLIAGIVKRLKCLLQNRRGPSIFQPYRDLNKLFHKETLVAENASIIFYITPYIIFSTTVLLSLLIPLLTVHSATSPLADIIVFSGLLALARFFLVLAGLDIGTAFGGLGASREMFIATMTEPALLMAFFTLALISANTNIAAIINHIHDHHLSLHPAIILVALGFAIISVAETGRIPVDNPATHLELTMCHEAMILEYSGHHLALIEWAKQIKFCIYCALLINIFFPWGLTYQHTLQAIATSCGLFIGKLVFLCLILVIAETNLAKLRLFRVPFLLNTAFMLCFLGALIHLVMGGN